MDAERIFQAVMRFYTERDYACLPEFTLKTNRRPDITCLHQDGTILMVEVKSSVNDFKTDKKWHEYAEWADRLYFAVGQEFPIEILPDEDKCGVIITDGFDCHITREAPLRKLAGSRRNNLGHLRWPTDRTTPFSWLVGRVYGVLPPSPGCSG